MAAPPSILSQCDKKCLDFCFLFFINFTMRDEFKTNTKSFYFYILVFILITCGVGLFRGMAALEAGHLLIRQKISPHLTASCWQLSNPVNSCWDIWVVDNRRTNAITIILVVEENNSGEGLLTTRAKRLKFYTIKQKRTVKSEIARMLTLVLACCGNNQFFRQWFNLTGKLVHGSTWSVMLSRYIHLVVYLY